MNAYQKYLQTKKCKKQPTTSSYGKAFRFKPPDLNEFNEIPKWQPGAIYINLCGKAYRYTSTVYNDYYWERDFSFDRTWRIALSGEKGLLENYLTWRYKYD